MLVRADSRILVIRLSAVGDVINTLPTLCALRQGFPNAFIGWIVEDRAYDLIRGHPAVDRVHLFPRRRWVKRWWTALSEAPRFVRQVRRERYDVAVELQGNLKGGVHALASGVRRRVGFSRGHCKEWSHLFTNVHVTPPGGERINRVDKFLSVAAFLGAPVNGATYRLPESADSRARVDAWLDTRKLDRFVVIHPGTSEFGKAKRWMPERFSALAEKIGRETGMTPVITWGPGEQELASEVVAGSGHAVLSMQTRSILDLAEIIRKASLFVGCDSGPLHLSSAVGTPSVALFGPKDPQIYGPYNPLHRVIWKPDANGNAMAAITVDDAFGAVRDLLEKISV